MKPIENREKYWKKRRLLEQVKEDNDPQIEGLKKAIYSFERKNLGSLAIIGEPHFQRTVKLLAKIKKGLKNKPELQEKIDILKLLIMIFERNQRGRIVTPEELKVSKTQIIAMQKSITAWEEEIPKTKEREEYLKDILKVNRAYLLKIENMIRDYLKTPDIPPYTNTLFGPPPRKEE